MLGTAFADDPVCRVQSIAKVTDGGTTLLHKRPGDANGFPVTLNCTGYVKDHYITDANTVAALEFLIGGRVGINKGSDVEIVDERSVADGKTPVKRIVLKKGGLWVKADAKQLKQPLEIQTNGGVMGIKGTEFTVETQADGSDRICCFESNSSQGGVEVRDTKGKVVGTAKPGDEYQASWKAAPVVTPHSNLEEFRSQTLESHFGELYNSPWGRTAMGLFGQYVPYVGSGVSLASGLFYNGMAIANFKKDPAAAGNAIVSGLGTAGVNTGPAGGYVSTAGGLFNTFKSNEPPKPDFPYELSPDGAPESKTAKEGPMYPSFSWKPVDDVESYAVMLAKDQNLDEVVFMEQTKSPQIHYPTTMRPLKPGTYYWRVIPLDGDDRPTKTASQTYFNVK